MTRLVIQVDGVRATGQTFTLAQAAREVARARERGSRWDARRALDPLGVRYRPLTPPEAQELIEATCAVIGRTS